MDYLNVSCVILKANAVEALTFILDGMEKVGTGKNCSHARDALIKFLMAACLRCMKNFTKQKRVCI